MRARGDSWNAIGRALRRTPDGIKRRLDPSYRAQRNDSALRYWQNLRAGKNKVVKRQREAGLSWHAVRARPKEVWL